MRFTKTIQQWFKDEWGGSLLLPDGWYGRPYDNQHALTSIEEVGDTLTIVLDQRLTICFTGLKSIKAKKGELEFGPFERLHFEWKSFDNDEKHGIKEYLTGEVKILTVPAP